MSSDVAALEPPRWWVPLRLRELWKARELLYFLAWRDVKVRYAQASLGAAWAILQPVLMMAILSIFLGRLAKVPSAGLPYPLFVFSGIVPWTVFANAVGAATDSLVLSANMVSKVYFPRLVLPLGALISWLPDLGIATALLVTISAVYGHGPHLAIVLLPVFAFALMLTAASVGVWLSALNVTYRDVRHAVPFVLQTWLFASPVVYPSSIVPDRFQVLYGLNPMAGVIEGFRWSLLGGHLRTGMLLASTAVTTVVLCSGLYYFRRTEQFFADRI